MAMAETASAGMANGAAGALKTQRTSVSESQLLDVLYEILAQGGDPHGELTGPEIEAFLHEHARAPKSQAEMLAFFARYELSTDPTVYGADAELGPIATGLHRERGPLSSAFSLDEAMSDGPHVEEPITGSHAIGKLSAPSLFAPATLAPSAPFVAPAVPHVNPGAPVWLRASVALLAILLVGGAAFSYTRAQNLQNELSQAQLQQRSTDAALTGLEQRASQLQSALRDSESGRRSLDVTLQTYMSEQATQRQAEQAALQKLLGPRYEKLTLQALSSAP